MRLLLAVLLLLLLRVGMRLLVGTGGGTHPVLRRILWCGTLLLLLLWRRLLLLRLGQCKLQASYLERRRRRQGCLLQRRRRRWHRGGRCRRYRGW